MNMDLIKASYENAKTFANAKSMVKRINNLLEIKPTEYIHPHLYVAEFEKLAARLFTAGIAKNKKEIVYTLNQLASIIKRFDISKTQNLRDKIDLFNYGDFKLPERDVTETTARPWEEMLELFNYEIENNPNRCAKLACVIFKHGYCLNIKEIYSTSTKLGRPIISQNFLDLDNLTWLLQDHKNDRVTNARKFSVTQEFVDELNKYIEMKDYLLFYKSNFEMYGTSLLSSIGISGFTNTEVRDSYLQYIWTNYSREDATKISSDIIGYLPEAIKKFAVKYANVGRCDLQDCQPHPLHLEDPVKYSVNGRVKVVVMPKLKIAGN
jgi:hypothetical protein